MTLYNDIRHGKKIPDLLLVPDTLKAYQQIAEGYRSTLLASLIGITGSVGKTTTRRMTASILGTQLKLHQTSKMKTIKLVYHELCFLLTMRMK